VLYRCDGLCFGFCCLRRHSFGGSFVFLIIFLCDFPTFYDSLCISFRAPLASDFLALWQVFRSSHIQLLWWLIEWAIRSAKALHKERKKQKNPFASF